MRHPREHNSELDLPLPARAEREPDRAPAWVTPELIDATIRAWQRHYPRPLTREDATEILLSVGRLFDALEDTHAEQENIRRAGPGEQP